MAIISQNITVPGGLVDGGVASASQITPLYATLNSFIVPDSIFLGTFKVALTDNSLTTLTMGGTQTKDWTLTTNTVPITKSFWFMLPFAWDTAGVGNFDVQLRMNGVAVTNAEALGTAAAGNGLIVGFMGARDSDIPRPLMMLIIDDASTFSPVMAAANLPTATMSTVGITVSNAPAAANFKVKYARFWVEG